jgi:hemerythrin superfamily protein
MSDDKRGHGERGNGGGTRGVGERALAALKGALPMSGDEDAVTLLKRDHDEVDDLFDEFFRMQESGSRAEKARIVTEVCALLTVHALIEEELFYPRAAREDQDTRELVREAAVEHSTMKDLIARLQAMRPDDEMLDATFRVLSEYVKHHVKEEEREMFPKVRASGLDLDAIGRALEQRKLELMTAVAATVR